NEPAAGSSERKAHCYLPLSRYRSREQQVRYVSAGDQQHKSYCSKNCEHHRSQGSHGVFGQSHKSDAVTGVGCRVELFEVSCYAAHVRLRPFQRDAGFESGDASEVPAAPECVVVWLSHRTIELTLRIYETLG